MKKRVLLVAVDGARACGLRRAAAALRGFETVVCTGGGAKRLAREPASDCTVVFSNASLRGPVAAAVGRIAARQPAPVLVVGARADWQEAEAALRAGALGYLAKRRVADGLAHAVARVLAREIYVSPRIKSRLLSRQVCE